MTRTRTLAMSTAIPTVVPDYAILIRRSRTLRWAIIAALAIIVSNGAAIAQDHSHVGAATAPKAPTADQLRRQNLLVAEVRQATDRFHDVQVAESEGYSLVFGCVSGSGDEGAMGMHFVNMTLIADGELHVDRPEIILYEPLPNGQVRITGADYFLDAATWNATHSGPPQLDGQLFHFFDSPNRFHRGPPADAVKHDCSRRLGYFCVGCQAGVPSSHWLSVNWRTFVPS